MVEAKSVAAIVTGALLAVLGGIGTLVVFVGALAGVIDWGLLAWLLPIAFVVGAGLLTYGTVDLATDLTGLLTGDKSLDGLVDDVGGKPLLKLLD